MNMAERQLAALQNEVNALLGKGTVELVKMAPMGGQFIFNYNGAKVALGASFEAALGSIRTKAGIGVKLAQPKPVWGERRGRPANNG